MQIDPFFWQVLQIDLIVASTVAVYLIGFYVLYKYRTHSPEYELGRAIVREQALMQSQIINKRVNYILSRVYPEILVKRGEITPEEKEKVKVPKAEELKPEAIERILREAEEYGIPLEAKELREELEGV